MNSLSAFTSEADEAPSTEWPRQTWPVNPAAVVIPAPARPFAVPNRRGPLGPAVFLAIPVFALTAIGAPLYYVYASPVRRGLWLPPVERLFKPVTPSEVPSLYLPPIEPAPAETRPRNPPALRARRTTAAPGVSAGAASGLLFVNARPWADVWVDGLSAGTTPLANLRVSVGTHEVVWKHPHLGERRQRVTVTAESPTRIGMNLQTP